MSTGYLPTRRSAIHEARTGIEITVVDRTLPPCGECPEAGPIVPGAAVIRYVGPATRMVISDVLCLTCLPSRLAQLHGQGIEILDLGLYSPLRIEHLFNMKEGS